MFRGRATPEATRRFLDSHEVHKGQIREFCGIPVSSLAMGTYLGSMDDVTDAKVALAGVMALDSGCNFFDSAINYRGQRGERSIGEAIRRAVLSGKVERNQIFVSTKAGFVPYEGKPEDIGQLFEAQYVSKGLARANDLIAGCHCMEPAFLKDQIARSRKNLGLETIDLYYLHNPETQLDELPERVFYEKLEAAFETFERAIQDGHIGAYGLATWNGFREEPGAQTSLQLEKCVLAAERAAAKVGAKAHGLKAIQLPLNLAMPEAALLKTQKFGSNMFSAIDAADGLGLSVATSVPLFQGRLCHNLPEFILERFPKQLSQAHCALAFVTAFGNVDAAMIGMKAADHVRHNLELLKMPPLPEEIHRKVIESMLA